VQEEIGKKLGAKIEEVDGEEIDIEEEEKRAAQEEEKQREYEARLKKRAEDVD
jgi:hypothetical protein